MQTPDAYRGVETADRMLVVAHLPESSVET